MAIGSVRGRGRSWSIVGGSDGCDGCSCIDQMDGVGERPGEETMDQNRLSQWFRDEGIMA